MYIFGFGSNISCISDIQPYIKIDFKLGSFIDYSKLKIPANTLSIKRTTSDINDSSLVSADHLSRNSK